MPQRQKVELGFENQQENKKRTILAFPFDPAPPVMSFGQMCIKDFLLTERL